MKIKYLEELKALRKELHRHPELSGNEIQTAAKVKEFLADFAPDLLLEGIGGAGLAAVYEGKAHGKTILIRCELDALPIQEINTFSHRSVRDGVAHKCGHDGHMAIVCGIATLLHSNRPEKGKVILLFQPAEENGKGAAAVINDDRFSEIKPDYAFALHNLPGFDKDLIVVKSGLFTVAVNSLLIKLEGKTAHAGEPQNGINPALAIAEITQSLQQLIQEDIQHPDYCLVTPVYIHMGEKAYGISAGSGEAHFTLRCRTNAQMQKLEAKAEQLVSRIASAHGLKADLSWTEHFFANQNDEKSAQWIREAAQAHQLELHEASQPFSWGEDFGLFTERFKGAMFGLGAGKNAPALHHPDYDFPDAIIEAGIKVFHAIIQNVKHV